MTAAAPRVDVDQLRHGVSLLALLPQDAKPRRTGKNAWMAFCSFHEDGAHASMSVRRVNIGWVYNCFACGEQGDVIAYVMRTERMAFRDAVTKMAEGGFVALEAPRARRAPVLLACDGHGCGARAEVEHADVVWLGVSTMQNWTYGKDGRTWCPDCTALAFRRRGGDRTATIARRDVDRRRGHLVARRLRAALEGRR